MQVKLSDQRSELPGKEVVHLQFASLNSDQRSGLAGSTPVILTQVRPESSRAHGPEKRRSYLITEPPRVVKEVMVPPHGRGKRASFLTICRESEKSSYQGRMRASRKDFAGGFSEEGL
jgi:hypothetical protein